MAGRVLHAAVVALTFVAAGAPARQAEAQPYVEVDPFAYPLVGFSVHAGRVIGSMRVEGGAFSLRVPSFLVAEEGWSVRVTGFVADSDWIGDSQRGFFAGLVGSALVTRYTLDATGAHATHTLWHLGPRAGYIWFPGGAEHFYIAPWANVGYIFNPEDITLGGEVYHEERWQPFVTVHLGWRW